MPKKTLTILILLLSSIGIAQQNKIKFQKPLKIPLYLSGNFAELRSNHFHSGLDIKTNKTEGLKVYASANGYVYRIKISRGGYGKALYVKHPETGLSTVYAHLKKFNPVIERYIKRKQYQKKKYEIEVFPYAVELPVKKGEIIAYSGNTGSSSGAHLHYEIRNEQEHPLNPMAYGIDIPDHKFPIINNLFIYPLNDSTHVNQIQNRIKINLKKKSDSLYFADSCFAYGEIGIGINAYDKQDGAYNRNGLYKVEIIANGIKVYEHVLDEFSFNKSRYINTFIDYPYYAENRSRIQRLWIAPSNKLQIYTQLVNDGKLIIKDKKAYYITLVLSDFKGNQTKVKLNISGHKAPIIEKRKIEKTPYFVKKDESLTINYKDFQIYFPKKIFYEDFYLKLNGKQDGLSLSNKGVPLHKSFKITYDLKNIKPELRKYTFIGRKYRKYLNHVGSNKKDGKIVGYSRNFGDFIIGYDSIPPTIKPLNFKNNSNLDNYYFLKLKIKDNKTGIKSYNGYIDGKWVLFEYEYKKALIIHDFSDQQLSKGRHRLRVVVEDLLGNQTVYKTFFYKRK